MQHFATDHTRSLNFCSLWICLFIDIAMMNVMIKVIKCHTMHISCGMNHMACIMNLPEWTSSVFFMRLSHSQRAAGQAQQETNSCQANSPLMHGWFFRRSYALGVWDEMGHEVICTIKSSCFSSKISLEMFVADIQSQSRGCMIGSHWKIHCWT